MTGHVSAVCLLRLKLHPLFFRVTSSHTGRIWESFKLPEPVFPRVGVLSLSHVEVCLLLLFGLLRNCWTWWWVLCVLLLFLVAPFSSASSSFFRAAELRNFSFAERGGEKKKYRRIPKKGRRDARCPPTWTLFAFLFDSKAIITPSSNNFPTLMFVV